MTNEEEDDGVRIRQAREGAPRKLAEDMVREAAHEAEMNCFGAPGAPGHLRAIIARGLVTDETAARALILEVFQPADRKSFSPHLTAWLEATTTSYALTLRERSGWRARLTAEGFKVAAITPAVLDLAIYWKNQGATDAAIIRCFANTPQARMEEFLADWAKGLGVAVPIDPRPAEVPPIRVHIPVALPNQALCAAVSDAGRIARRLKTADVKLPEGTSFAAQINTGIGLLDNANDRLGGLRWALQYILGGRCRNLLEAQLLARDVLFTDHQRGGPPVPEIERSAEDGTIRMGVRAHFGWRDRAKILLGARVEIEQTARCERDPGAVDAREHAITVTWPLWWPLRRQASEPSRA